MIALEVPIVAFGKSFDRSRFTSGNADLDDWLRTKAGQGERSDNTRTFLALDPGGERVIGYYATTTYRLELDEAARALGAGKRRYPGCRPYAAAIASSAAEIDRCPPGGEATVRALAELLDRALRPLDPEFGVPKPAQVAWIDEARCIGCARCLPACPVDAIVGTSRQMHTVITRQCTGCELCLPPCPVDCIELRPAPAVSRRYSQPRAA